MTGDCEPDTGNLKKKRRGLNAPCPEAPRSAYTASTPSRAHLGALGQLLCGLGKFEVFGAARSRSYAKLLIMYFWSFNYLCAGSVVGGKFVVKPRSSKKVAL